MYICMYLCVCVCVCVRLAVMTALVHQKNEVIRHLQQRLRKLQNQESVTAINGNQPIISTQNTGNFPSIIHTPTNSSLRTHSCHLTLSLTLPLSHTHIHTHSL